MSKDTASSSAATKKRPAAAMEPKSDELVLATAINALAKSSEALLGQMENYKAIQDQITTKTELELSVKRKKQAEFEEEFNRSLRDQKIKLDDEVRQYGLKACQQILTDRGLVAVSKEEYDNLKKAYLDLKGTMDTQVADQVRDEHERLQKDYMHKMTEMELKQKAEAAQWQAEIKQLQEVNKAQVAELGKFEKRLQEAIVLTKDVANACKAPAITQHMGGK